MEISTLDTFAPILASADDLVPIVAMAIGGSIALTAIIFGTAKRIAQTRSREASRREIAAYVAEGAMSAEEGKQLLDAGQDKPD